MVPYEIDILLHYYSRCEDHEDIVRDPPVWRPTMLRFIEQGLIEHSPGDGVTYALTDRGKCYVEALQRVPLPVWSMPACDLNSRSM